MKRSLKVFAVMALLWAAAAFGQVFTTLYLPTVRENPSSSLYISVAAGRVFCGTSMVSYAGGTLLMTASTTNYVYLNTASSCALAVKTTTFVLGDIPIAVAVAGSSTITSVTDQRTGFTKLPSVAGAGVSSLNSLTGALNLMSSDSSVTITPSGSSINLQAAGGGSGVQYNPTNTLYVFTGDSENGDDTHALGIAIPVSSGNCDGTTCTVNTTSAHGLAIGDWIDMNGVTGWTNPDPGWGTGQNVNQVVSVPTGSSITFSNSQVATLTGGTMYNANFFEPMLTMQEPFFKGHGSMMIIAPTSSTLASLATNFNSLFTATAPVTTGNPAFLIIQGGKNDINACTAPATIEGYLQTIWADAHTLGYKVVQSTIFPSPWNVSLGCTLAFINQQTVNQWIADQGRSVTTASSGEYWDRLNPLANVVSNLNSSAQIASNGGLGPAGAAAGAKSLNNGMGVQDTFPSTAPYAFGSTNGGGLALNLLSASSQSFGIYDQSNRNYFTADTSGGHTRVQVPLDVSSNVSSGSFAAPLNITNNYSGGNSYLGLFLNPNMPNGKNGSIIIGKSSGDGNIGELNYLADATNPSINLQMDATTGAAVRLFKNGGVQLPTVLSHPCIGTDGSGNLTSVSCVTSSSGGTSVSQNSGSAETNLPITGYMPQICSDTSGSGTAQSCTVANTFTPQAGNCLVYKTTTANSGTGLTVNINSLGAKSIAVAGSSGWTTALVASSSIPANKPMNLCYDGTNWDASGTGYVPASGGGGGTVISFNSTPVTLPGSGTDVIFQSTSPITVTSSTALSITAMLTRITTGTDLIVSLAPSTTSCRYSLRNQSDGNFISVVTNTGGSDTILKAQGAGLGATYAGATWTLLGITPVSGAGSSTLWGMGEGVMLNAASSTSCDVTGSSYVFVDVGTSGVFADIIKVTVNQPPWAPF